MKVLHLSKYYKPYSGGIEQVVADICEACNKDNIESSVLAVNYQNTNSIYYINGVKVYSYKSNLHYASADISLGYIQGLKKIISYYDIIHVHLPNPLANLAVLLAKHESVKVVLHWHSDIVKQKFLKILYRPMQSWLLNRSDAIITTSPIYGECSEDLFEYKNKITVIPIGINADNYKVDDNVFQAIKSKFRDKKIIFALGRLVYYKGFSYLIEAAGKLPDDHIILIGGRGPESQQLIDKVDKLNLHDKVKMLGFVDENELPAYLKACDVFCLPSIEKSEAFGVVQLEAFLFNKPVVSCSITGSGVGWVNRDQISGIVVPPKNSHELASALIKITQNQDSYSSLHSYFEDNFTSTVMVLRTVNLYKSLFNCNAC